MARSIARQVTLAGLALLTACCGGESTHDASGSAGESSGDSGMRPAVEPVSDAGAEGGAASSDAAAPDARSGDAAAPDARSGDAAAPLDNCGQPNVEICGSTYPACSYYHLDAGAVPPGVCTIVLDDYQFRNVEEIALLLDCELRPALDFSVIRGPAGDVLQLSSAACAAFHEGGVIDLIGGCPTICVR